VADFTSCRQYKEGLVTPSPAALILRAKTATVACIMKEVYLCLHVVFMLVGFLTSLIPSYQLKLQLVNRNAVSKLNHSEVNKIL